MGKAVLHPKNVKRCAFCKRWDGDANLVFKSPQAGYQFESSVYGKCFKNNSKQLASGGVNCKDYEPSPEANKLL